MSRQDYVYVTYIATTPEKLWEALTTPEFTRQYWGGRTIESDWEIGSAARMKRPDGNYDWEGEIVECDPPRLLSYTWNSFSTLEGGASTRVTFRIEPYGSLMRLTVLHEGFEPESPFLKSISQGWPAILSSLKTMLETGKALVYDAWKG